MSDKVFFYLLEQGWLKPVNDLITDGVNNTNLNVWRYNFFSFPEDIQRLIIASPTRRFCLHLEESKQEVGKDIFERYEILREEILPFKNMLMRYFRLCRNEADYRAIIPTQLNPRGPDWDQVTLNRDVIMQYRNCLEMEDYEAQLVLNRIL